MNSPTQSTPKAFGVNNALAGTPTNCNTVAVLPPDAELATVIEKVNELINALRR